MRQLGYLLASIGLLSACNKWPSIQGSGVLKTESRPAADFTAVHFSTQGDLVVKQTGKESLTITAEDNILPLLRTRVDHGELTIDTDDGVHMHPNKPIQVVVEVKSLDSLHLSGVGDVKAAGIKAKHLAVHVSGVGSTRLSGAADELELHISGVGHFDGKDFKTKRVRVHASGVGGAVVNVSDQLDADVSGVGNVEYVGNPRIDQHVSGVGHVNKL